MPEYQKGSQMSSRLFNIGGTKGFDLKQIASPESTRPSRVREVNVPSLCESVGEGMSAMDFCDWCVPNNSGRKWTELRHCLFTLVNNVNTFT